ERLHAVPVMMTPPASAHQRIASNLERLLREALRAHAPALTAYQCLGVNIAPSVGNYDPEPDVIVVDAASDDDTKERYIDCFYLAAEVVSVSDRGVVEAKRAVYRLHQHCRWILTIEQDRYEVRIDHKSGTDWVDQVLKSPDDLVVLAEFGLHCKVSGLYSETALD